MQRIVRVWNEGLIRYEQACNLQKTLVACHFESADAQDTLLLVEHPPVYTVGLRTAQYNDEEASRLRGLGAEFHRTNRGGLITFHGPGQLVAYPIINLKRFGLGVRQYVCLLERTVMLACTELGINNARTSPEPGETGIWVGNSKICALGVHASRQVTSHGLALNCNTDLHWYTHIVPCGLVGRGVTSLTRELNRDVTIQETSPILVNAFCKTFQCHYEPYSKKKQTAIKKSISVTTVNID